MSDKKKIFPEIVFSQHGPYMIVDAESLQNWKHEEIKIAKVTSVCRCGESEHKPFCDGTHGKVGFVGEKEDGRARNRLKDFIGTDIAIHFNLGICSHSAKCIMGLPEVFDVKRKPWIDPDAADVDEIMKVVATCPSGALSYTIDGQRYTDFPRPPLIKLTKNGPIEVEGGLLLKDDANSVDELESVEHYSLCRCGKSKNKPFCDGTHHHVMYKSE